MSYDIVKEDVPRFIRRVGDQVVQGSNNSVLILGTDRAKAGPAGLADGLGHAKASNDGKGTGTAHLVVGRADKDPDLKKDLAYLYLSMKTKVDSNLELENVEKASNDLPAAILKSDAVRLVFRKNIKIVLDGGKNYIYLDSDGCTIKIDQSFIKMTSDTITVESQTLKLGKNATKHILQSEAFLAKHDTHIHPTTTPGANTGVPVVPLSVMKETLSTTGTALGKPEILIP